MLQYPVELGISSATSGEESETQHISNVGERSEPTTATTTGAGVDEGASTMTATSVMVGDAGYPTEGSVMGDSGTLEEMDREFDTEMLSRSLYSGKVIQTIEDVDDDDDDSELRHVLDVLGLNTANRQSIRREGIRRLSDIYDIEALLQQGRVSSLRSVETAKLLQFLEWVQSYQSKGAHCTLPNVQRDFTTDEYLGFIECERSRKHAHTWPFSGIDTGETSLLLLPVAYSVEDMIDASDEEERVVPQSFSQQDVRSARIVALFSLAEQSHKEFHEGSKKGLKEAMDRYRLVARETAVSVDDCKLQAFACIKLAILLHRVEYQNHREALDLLETAAVKFRVPTAMFFYGAALVTGHGGLVKDIPAGVAMLQDAAAAGIWEAYYVLGNIHESGNTGERDLNAARQYYETASHAFRASVRFSGTADQGNEPDTEGEVHISNNVSSDTDGIQPPGHWDTEFSGARGLIMLEEWRSSSSRDVGCSTVTGEGFIWSALVAQALLVAAAAILSKTTQVSHYPALLPLVPCIGIVLACFSVANVVQVIIGNRAKRRLYKKVQETKLTAYRRMLQVGAWHEAVIPPLHYLLLWQYRCLRWFRVHGGCARRSNSMQIRIELLEANILWLEARGSVTMNRFVTWLVEFLGLLVGFAFLAGWAVLLAQEIRSFTVDDCSNWWESTCQGSQVLCTEDANRLETCASLTTTDFSTYTFKLVPQ